ncbi:MAG: alpha/beta hydrolase family protein [Casimicrobiaceae bacterium]
MSLLASVTTQAGAVLATEETWFDEARQRPIPLRLLMPEAASSEDPDTTPRPAPLLMISREPGGASVALMRWAPSLVARGYAVLEITHPGPYLSRMSAEGQQAVGSRRPPRARGVTPEQLLGRSDDVRFVLTELRRRRAVASASDSPWRHIDSDRIAYAGEGGTARLVQAMAGERYPGPIPSLAEPSFHAFIAVAPATQGVRASASERYGAMRRPFLSIVVPSGGEGALPPLARQLALFDAQPEGGKWRLAPPRAHIAARVTAHHEDAAADLAAAFLDRYLREAVGAAATLEATAAALRSHGYRIDSK